MVPGADRNPCGGNVRKNGAEPDTFQGKLGKGLRFGIKNCLGTELANRICSGIQGGEV